MTARSRPRRNSAFYLPSAFDLFAPSRDLVLKNLTVFGPLFAILFIFWFHAWASIPAGAGHYWGRAIDANFGWTTPNTYGSAFIGFSIIWFLLSLVIGTIVQIMLQKAQLDASSDRPPSTARAWETVKQLGWRMLGLYIVMAIIIMVGFILLIVPGLFMIRRYIFAPYVMLERKCSIGEALNRSHELSMANTSAVWGLIGVLFLIDFIGIIPIIGSIASFILGGLYCVAPALRYKQLKGLRA